MVIWIVGMSGSGKTSLGHAVTARLRAGGRTVVLLDGDEMRRILGRQDLGSDYGVGARRAVTERYRDICRWLDDQGVDVVCCVIGMFPDLLVANRSLYSGYLEVFLDAPLELLAERDAKGLYRRALEGSLRDVVGIDIPFPPPPGPDVHLPVRVGMPTPEELAADVVARLEGRTG